MVARISETAELASITNYLLNGDSALSGQGLDLNSLYGLALPATDFSGEQLPADGYSVGACNSGMTSNSPAILIQPADVTCNTNRTISFTVGASGTQPLRYQWQTNFANVGTGGQISGATTSTLTFTGTTPANSNTLVRCIIANDYGSVTSNIAKLTVTNGPPAPPISVVQSIYQAVAGTASSVSVTLPNVQAGNRVVVLYSGNSAPASISDGVAGYTLDYSYTFAAPKFMTAWSRKTSASGSLTVTVSTAHADVQNLCVYELAGTADDNAFDAGTVGAGISFNPTTALFNTSAAGIIIVMEGEDAPSGTCTHTAVNGYTIGGNHQDNASLYFSGASEYLVSNGVLAGATASLTLDQSCPWYLLAVAYKQKP